MSSRNHRCLLCIIEMSCSLFLNVFYINFMKRSLLLYIQIIRPLNLYATPVWGQCATIHIKTNSSPTLLRVISNAPWFVRNEALCTDFKLPTIKENIKKLSISFFGQLHKASSPQYYRLNIRPINHRLMTYLS